MMTLPLYTFPEPEDKEVEALVLRDPWDIHFELVQAVRILENLKKGSNRPAIFNQIEIVEDLRAKHMEAVLRNNLI